MDLEKDFIQRGWERIWSNFRRLIEVVAYLRRGRECSDWERQGFSNWKGWIVVLD
jgi:hypothetical protein